jgi:hypothetical protein
MGKPADKPAAVDGARALAELVSRLPTGPAADAIRAEVDKLRRLSTQPRPRRRSERARLLALIADADRDYQNAVADGSHQAADRCRRHLQDLEAKLDALTAPPAPTRRAMVEADPRAPRVEWLTTHLLEVEADLQYLRSTDQWSLIPALDARAHALRDELDLARSHAGQVVPLDRSPAAVADEVERRAKRLAELAAKAREREL